VGSSDRTVEEAGMKWIHFLTVAALSSSLGGTSAGAQEASSPNSSVRMIVTAESRHGANVPVINQDEVMVFEGRDKDTVTEWIPAQGDHAALELFILVDDSANSSLGSQLEDLRQFINAQPPTTLVGVAYMQNGIARILQNPTAEHAQAAKQLRLPTGIGGANGSPYFSLSDLVKRWPPSNARHEVLMVSSGIDRYYGTGDLSNPYLQSAIDDAGKAGVLVSAIYTPDVGHFGHSYWQSYWGQLYLSQLAERTGGEAYYIGFTGAPVTFAPYLDDLEHRLQHQYILGFIPKPQTKAGWQKVRVATEAPNVDLVAAGRVYVSER
jgi:hypothetical protein